MAGSSLTEERNDCVFAVTGKLPLKWIRPETRRLHWRRAENRIECLGQ